MNSRTSRWVSYTPESIEASSFTSDLEPLQTFHPFNRLPKELRSLIYEFASPPQLIYTQWYEDEVSRSHLTIDTDALRDQYEHMKEQFANVTMFVSDRISFYFRPNPLLSVSKEARGHLITREKLYVFDKALCNTKTIEEPDVGRKVTVSAFITEIHEDEMVRKEMEEIDRRQASEEATPLTLSYLWNESYWTPRIRPMLCMRNAIFVGDYWYLWGLQFCLGKPFVEAISSIAISYQEWKDMMDLKEGRDPLEDLLLDFAGLKEIIFNYDVHRNTDNLPPPWMTVEGVITENMQTVKKRHKEWRVPNFWVIRNTKKRQLLRRCLGRWPEYHRMLGIGPL
ncbi:hypothetical protein IFR05_014977 [Cadophora sp. M221]|nr:hypothetical protein IFR05_014977 [Cadophora sp. M221]